MLKIEYKCTTCNDYGRIYNPINHLPPLQMCGKFIANDIEGERIYEAYTQERHKVVSGMVINSRYIFCPDCHKCDKRKKSCSNRNKEIKENYHISLD